MIQEAFDLAEVEDTLFLRPLLNSTTLGECAEVWLMQSSMPLGMLIVGPQGNTMFYSKHGEWDLLSIDGSEDAIAEFFEDLAAAFTQGYEEEGCDALFFH